MRRLHDFLSIGSAWLPGQRWDALREQITTPQAPFYPDIPGASYAYGLMITQGITLADGYHDVTVWQHGGNTFTHTSTFTILPEQRFAISILSNGYGDDFSKTDITAACVFIQQKTKTKKQKPKS